MLNILSVIWIFYMGIKLRVFKFREDFYSGVFISGFFYNREKREIKDPRN